MKRLPPPAPWRLLLTLATLRRRGGALPSGLWQWQGEALQASDWQRYAERLDYPPLQGAPLCFHYLALQRAQLQAMLAPDFPHPLPGMVHLAQTLTREAPWQAAEPWHLTLTMEQTETPSGALHLRMRAAFVQHGTCVLRADSLYLARRSPRRDTAPPAAQTAPDLRPLSDWALNADAGRRYARLSGDFNPIHLWAWSARWFGQREPIIHGMHSAARCEAELTRHLGRPLQHLHIEFRRPLGLPNRATLHLQEESGFELRDDAGRRVAKGNFA
ncbi:MAG: hypothetical protein J0L58_20585 [Burkholderiales bacterium]|nr:hypothetical protein [Burkholderiales bacterium]